MTILCKVCGHHSLTNIGSVDSGRANNPIDPFPFGKTGVDINYWQCESCSFIFTKDWDGKDASFWQEEIYNSDYVEHVDPEYNSIRSDLLTPVLLSFAKIVSESLFANDAIDMLDYGSGTGRLHDNFKAAGKELHSYDPYSLKSTILTNKTYDLIFAIEVFEHEVQPKFLMNNLARLTAEDAVVIFSTKLSKDSNLDWKYIAPRNGHLSIYSKQSLHALASSSGFMYQRLAFFHVLSKRKLSSRLILNLVLSEVKHRFYRELNKRVFNK